VTWPPNYMIQLRPQIPLAGDEFGGSATV